MGKNVKMDRGTLKFKHFILLFALAIVLITVIMAAEHIPVKSWESRSVATINGEPITVSEIMPQLNQHRSEVVEYFKTQYNIEPGKLFWKSEFKGEVPAERLKTVALNEYIRIKVHQILAKEKGLAKDISYSKFLEDLKKENERREIALKNKEVIYGPQQYTEDAYFSVVYSDMFFQLQNKVADQIHVSDGEIEEYYEEAIKNNIYKETERIKIQKAALPYEAGDDKSKEAARDKAEEIKGEFDKGEKFEILSEAYGKDPSIQIEFGEQISDDTTRREDFSPLNHEFTEKIRGLSAGQVSDVFETNHTYYVVKCIEKTDGAFYALDDVSGNITEVLKEQKYTGYIDDLVQKAEVVIDQSVYSKLKIE